MGAKKVSKLTEKYQATIPKEVRQALRLSKGDTILFELDGDQITLKKATELNLEWLAGLDVGLSEWNSLNDDEAYKNL